MSNLSPIFDQALAPWTPPMECESSESRQREYALCQNVGQVLNVMSGLPPTEAERIEAEIAAGVKNANWHQANDSAALACQIAAQDMIDRPWKGYER